MNKALDAVPQIIQSKVMHTTIEYGLQLLIQLLPSILGLIPYTTSVIFPVACLPPCKLAACRAFNPSAEIFSGGMITFTVEAVISLTGIVC